MKALITGTTGFVGSHLADYLIDQQGIEVHGIRRPRSRNEFVRYDVHYHEGDILDYSSVANIIAKVGPSCIFHLAAQSFVPLSWTAPRPTLEANIIGTLNILEAARETPLKTSILIAGSSEEYGMVYPAECPITEGLPLRPLSPYGVSKVAADIEVRRIALSMEQIEELQPPPNPAKITDSRYASYAAEYGEDSWELDALEPRYIVNLIEEHIFGERDIDKWDEAVEEQEAEREQIQEIIDRWDEMF